MSRPMRFAGSFYPGTEYECKEMIAEMEKDVYKPNVNFKNAVGGIVPHAGWVFSGKISFSVFNAIKEFNKEVDTFILFSANHSAYISKSAIVSKGKWQTPFGEIEIDENLAGKILKEGKIYVEDNSNAHANEHSIEVQLPFIKFLFPNAKIVTIMPVISDDAIKLGEIVGNIVKKEKEERQKNIVIVGTSDLTHYGLNYDFTPKGCGTDALKWVKEVNDKKIINLMLNLEYDKIIEESNKNMNACGPGAISAIIAAAKILGSKKGNLIKYATSYDVFPQYGMDSFVGYAGVLF